MGILDRSIRVSFSIRPFMVLFRIVFLSLLTTTACVPTPMGSLPVPPPPLSQAQIASNIQVAFVQSELEARLKNKVGIEIPAVATTLVLESHKAGFDPLFVLAVIETESNFDADACSGSKAKGLMQILPSTFASLNPTGSIFDPVENVRAGVLYLSILTKTFQRPESLLMAYNGGPGAAGRHLRASQAGQPSDGSWEMRSYPGKVMGNYKRLLVKTGHPPSQAHKLFRVSKRPISLASR